ncbi:hypothetical protein F7725_021694 [Dissostichus mawsoni]|uniref:Platelet glycoprotein 4 n=1 Tax=Dissostichus mawsoni TaxID=36200 RepID=A0A7J5ZBX8_DISMA|nr:hypothetical protein F7725_021694 [Dissostichus mawsoni]
MGCCNRRCGLIAGAVFGAVVAILGGILIPVGKSVIEGTVEKMIHSSQWAAGLLADLKGAIFEPSMSVGTEEDKVTSLNLGVAVRSLFSGSKTISCCPGASDKDKQLLVVPKPYSWRNAVGYYDPLLKDNIGLFSPYNGTYDGIYNVFDGKDNISKVGFIDRWRGQSVLTFWDDKYCDMINGTDASSFPPFLDKKPLYFFSSDICRSVSAGFEQSMDLKGIEVYRYVLQPNTLASPTVNPDNQCFCRNEVTTNNCTMAGVLDISSCQAGQFAFVQARHPKTFFYCCISVLKQLDIKNCLFNCHLNRETYLYSLAHFLGGSRSLHENVKGLNPSEKHHGTYLDVEPTTGFTLRFAKRIQTASLDDATADMLKKELISRIEMLDIIQKALLGTGVAIFVLCFISYCVVRRNQSKIV